MNLQQHQLSDNEYLYLKSKDTFILTIYAEHLIATKCLNSISQLLWVIRMDREIFLLHVQN